MHHMHSSSTYTECRVDTQRLREYIAFEMQIPEELYLFEIRLQLGSRYGVRDLVEILLCRHTFKITLR
eukprot:CAMPEP_0114313002 /NCGR_PEP_ID=MMETSP0059-20121206/20830_1 /TAXON_ID=36894 /ORGANISM="Pyramimonas parkeae, Strain CCMP726" /LENGTH=67 /DNA_ID=CAMNT_0001437623 /DNA_START=469 /DNA_END=669 /DNA_ORIENTATION=-